METIKAGETVKAYGYEWEVLDPDYNGGIMCLMKEQIKEMPFDVDGNNYYPESDICDYLAELTGELEAKGASFEKASLSMLADDGTGWDKEDFEVKGLFLLTEDLYRKYRRYISNKENWWWLATAYSYSSSTSYYARFVRTDGSLGNNYAYVGDYGVAPACLFSFLSKESDNTVELSERELKQRIRKLNKQIRELTEKLEEVTA